MSLPAWLPIRSVVTASALPEISAAPVWGLPGLTGRLVELSACGESAYLTVALGLVRDAQCGGDRAAWVTVEQSAFFPPDAADSGIDLEAFPVVRVSDAAAAGRAADHLVRSGGFGLVVVDLSGAGASVLPVPLLTRLLGMARQQDVAVLLLTKKPAETASLHSLISLRAEATRRQRDGRYEVSVRVLKDKRSGPGWRHVEVCRGPAGLR